MAPSAIAAHPLKGEVVGSTIVEPSPPPSLDAKRTVPRLRPRGRLIRHFNSQKLSFSTKIASRAARPR